MEITSIQGKALLDRDVMIRLLGALEPADLGRESNLFDVGYERCKADILQIIARSMGTEFAQSAGVRLIKELRRDRGA